MDAHNCRPPEPSLSREVLTEGRQPPAAGNTNRTTGGNDFLGQAVDVAQESFALETVNKQPPSLLPPPGAMPFTSLATPTVHFGCDLNSTGR